MTTIGFNAMGGRGVISVVSNLVPKLSAQIQQLSLSGAHEKAREIHAQLVPLIQAMFVETNPMPVKFAAQLLGKCTGHMRLPLVAPTAETQAMLRTALSDLKLL